MQGYTAGQVIQTYTNEGYTAYQGVGGVTPDVLVNQNVDRMSGRFPAWSRPRPAAPTYISRPRICWATATCCRTPSRSVVLGSAARRRATYFPWQPASWRRAWTWTSRSSRRTCRRSTTGPQLGIYDKLIPILQQWNQQYDFVGSYYINIGDNPTSATRTDSNRLDEEPALLPGDPGDGRRDRQPLLHPSHQPADYDLHGATVG